MLGLFSTIMLVGDGGGQWIVALVMLCTFGTTKAFIMVTAQVCFSMARRVCS